MRRSRFQPVALLAAGFLLACGGGGGDGGSGPSPTVSLSGVVRNATSGSVLAGATVTVGGRSAVSGADGRYQLDGLGRGTLRVQATRSGFDPYVADVPADGPAATHDIGMLTQTVFTAGQAAIFIPREVTTVRGVILHILFHDTRGIVTGSFAGADPNAETNMRRFREGWEPMARRQGLALVGIDLALVQQGSPAALADALTALATASGRPEIAQAPVLPVGFSSGGPLAIQFMLAYPERTIGLLLRVPQMGTSSEPAAVWPVPVYIVLAELEPNPVLNPNATAFFERNRQEGARWAIAVEPGAGHFGPTLTARDVMVAWAEDIAARRLGSAPGPLVSLAESSGWLGNRADGTVAAWDGYGGTRETAAWLPGQQAAAQWRSLGGFAP